jgi:Tol biopolymer transport system component
MSRASAQALFFIGITFLFSTFLSCREGSTGPEIVDALQVRPEIVSFQDETTSANRLIRFNNLTADSVTITNVLFSGPGFSIEPAPPIGLRQGQGADILLKLDMELFNSQDETTAEFVMTGTDKTNPTITIWGPPKLLEIKISTTNADDIPTDFSPVSNTILFHSNRTGSMQIYTTNINRNERQITDQDNSVFSVCFNNSGNLILAYQTRGDLSDLLLINHQLQAVDTVLTLDGEIRPVGFNKDDSQILFSANTDGKWNVFTTSVSGESVTQLTDGENDEFAGFFHPTDNALVFYEQSRQGFTMYTMSSNGSNVRRLSTDFSSDIPRDTQTESPYRLLFFSDRENNREAFSSSWTGNSATRLTQNTFYDNPVAYSANGNVIAVNRTLGSNQDIILVQENPLRELRATFNRSLDAAVDFSFDNTYMLFYRESPNSQIYLIDYSDFSDIVNDVTD